MASSLPAADRKVNRSAELPSAGSMAGLASTTAWPGITCWCESGSAHSSSCRGGVFLLFPPSWLCGSAQPHKRHPARQPGQPTSHFPQLTSPSSPPTAHLSQHTSHSRKHTLRHRSRVAILARQPIRGRSPCQQDAAAVVVQSVPSSALSDPANAAAGGARIDSARCSPSCPVEWRSSDPAASS